MAKVNRCIPTASIDAYMDFFDDFNCPIISVDSANSTITIDGTITIEIVVNSGYTNGRDWNITYNGETYSLLQQGSATIWLCCSDKFVWFTVESSDTNKICFLYEKIGNKKLCGHSYSAKSGSPDIHGVTLTDLSTQDTYSHGKNLNYSCESQYPDCYTYMDYTDDALISNSFRSDLVDTNTLACSTTTVNKIITFAGDNYFALGTNTIIKIDTD